MSEAATEAVATETETTDTEQKPKPTETVEFWRQKARENESRAKSNAEAAKRLAEIEEASKTESQRLAEERDREKSRGDSAEALNLKLQVALAKAPDGTKPTEVAALAARLTGSTQEELEADADELFRLLGKTGRPTGDAGQGARGAEVAPSANDWIRRQIAKA